MRVTHTARDTAESITRQRKCLKCGHKVFTVEIELPQGAARHNRAEPRIVRLARYLRVTFPDGNH
jgi:hypothetical protein